MNLYTDDDIIPTTPDPTGNTFASENKIISVDSDDDTNQHLLDINQNNLRLTNEEVGHRQSTQNNFQNVNNSNN